ncbi:MAG: DUF2784 family protein [Patescibacteria group bacterium]|nr:DUF2784 family protein [Patescibacteria group bacterium]
MNKFKLLADVCVVFHFLWIVLILLSLPLMFVFDFFKYIAILLIFGNILAWIVWKVCPLFIWEKKLRAKYDKSKVYDEAFITHYAKKYLGIYISTTVIRIFLYSYGLLVLIIALNK